MTSTTGTGLTNAVRINCCASKPVFESVTLTDGDVERLKMCPRFPDGDPYDSSQIARRIGIPLCADIHCDGKEPAEIGVGWPYALALHTCLALDIEEESEVWGSNHIGWPSRVGDVYVIREDGKPLCPKLLEALCVWCWHELEPQFEKANKQFERAEEEFERAQERSWAADEDFEGELIDNREQVVALITKENFEAFRENWDRKCRIEAWIQSTYEKMKMSCTSTDEVQDIRMEMD